MRLDSRRGDTGWHAFDMATCSVPHGMVWVDDEIAAWGQYDTARSVLLLCAITGIDVPIVEHAERRIVIYPERKFILLNPIEDDDDSSVGAVDAIAREVTL